MPYELEDGAFEAYTQGRMDPEDVAIYEADLASGEATGPVEDIKIPRVSDFENDEQYKLSPGAMKAYQDGTMTEEDVKIFEADIDSGLAIPDLTAPDLGQATKQPLTSSYGGAPAVAERKRAPGILDRAGSAVKEMVTGNERSTKFIEGTRDWTELDIPGFVGDLTTFMGTLSTGPKESMEILAANLGHGAKVEYDAKDNPYILNPLDGQYYGYKPGIRGSDIPRIAGTVAREAVVGKGLGMGLNALSRVNQGIRLLTPIRRGAELMQDAGTLATGSREAIIEGVNQLGEFAAGGEANAVDPLTAFGASAVLRQGGKLIGKGLVEPVQISNAIERVQRNPNSTEYLQKLKDLASKDPELAQQILDAKRLSLNDAGLAVKHRPMDELTALAAKGDKKAIVEMADALKINQGTVKASEKLGMKDELPLTVLADKADPATKEVLDNVSKITKETELDNNMKSITAKMTAEMDKFEGTTDLSIISGEVDSKMRSLVQKAKDVKNSAYNSQLASIPKGLRVDAPHTIKLLEEELAKKERGVGIPKYLSELHAQLKTNIGPNNKKLRPTYILLNDLEKEAGKKGGYNALNLDPDQLLAQKVQAAIRKDQDEILTSLGPGHADALKNARDLNSAYRKTKDTAYELLGKKYEDGLAPTFNTALESADAGDTVKMIKMIESLPKEHRKSTVTSLFAKKMGIDNATGKYTPESFSQFYHNMKNNSALMAVLKDEKNFPKEGLELIEAMGDISTAISTTKKGLTKDSGVAKLKEDISGDQAAGFLMNLWDKTKSFAAAGTAIAGFGAVAGGTTGGFNVAMATTIRSLMSAESSKKVKKFVSLLSSPEFKAMALAPKVTPQMIKNMSNSDKMKVFMKSIGRSTKPSSIENFINKSIVRPSTDQMTDDPKPSEDK